MAKTPSAPVEPVAEPVVEPATPTNPAEPATPPGTVSLTAAEHDRLQADARTAKRRLAKMEEDEVARTAAEQAEAARAAGDFDEALRIERDATQGLRDQLTLRDVSDAIREEISGLGYSGSRASGLQRLVNARTVEMVDGAADPDGVTAAVAATM